MKSLPLVDGPVTFEGAVSLEKTDRGVHPWRLPQDHRDLFEPVLLNPAMMATGVRMVLRSDTRAIDLAFEPVDEILDDSWRFDLRVDGAAHAVQSHAMVPGHVRFDDLPEGEHRLELWLPQFGAIQITSLAIDDGASARRIVDDRPRWICYGSSITHCRAATGPSQTWPAIVANRLSLHLTCMGFGGQCKLDPPVARVIRDLPADYISLCLGINVYKGDLTERTFRPAVLGLIQTIRDGHPDTPIACVSPLYCSPRETGNGMTLPCMREMVHSAVRSLQHHGDANLHYISGLTLFGPDQAHHMPDELHPDAEGYRVLADRYLQHVMPHLGLGSTAG